MLVVSKMGNDGPRLELTTRPHQETLPRRRENTQAGDGYYEARSQFSRNVGRAA
jgi:hypothetical protein